MIRFEWLTTIFVEDVDIVSFLRNNEFIIENQCISIMSTIVFWTRISIVSVENFIFVNNERFDSEHIAIRKFNVNEMIERKFIDKLRRWINVASANLKTISNHDLQNMLLEYLSSNLKLNKYLTKNEKFMCFTKMILDHVFSRFLIHWSHFIFLFLSETSMFCSDVCETLRIASHNEERNYCRKL